MEWNCQCALFISTYTIFANNKHGQPDIHVQTWKTIHFLKPLLQGVVLQKSEFYLVRFPGISGHFRLVWYYITVIKIMVLLLILGKIRSRYFLFETVLLFEPREYRSFSPKRAICHPTGPPIFSKMTKNFQQSRKAKSDSSWKYSHVILQTLIKDPS